MTSLFQHKWKQIDSLNKNGLYRDALKVLESIQADAVSQNQVWDFVESFERYDAIFTSCLFETDEKHQKLADFEEKVQHLKAPFSNVMHHFLFITYELNPHDWEISSYDTWSFSFNRNGENIIVLPENSSEISSQHLDLILENESVLRDQLLVLDPFHVNRTELFLKNYASLFDVYFDLFIAEKRQTETEIVVYADSTLLGSSELFLKNSSTSILNLFQRQELYHWKTENQYAYVFWTLKRMEYVLSNQNSATKLSAEYLADLYATLEARLQDHPAVLAVILKRSILLQHSSLYNWRTQVNLSLNEETHQLVKTGIAKFPESLYLEDAEKFVRSIENQVVNFRIQDQVVIGKSSLLTVEYKNLSELVLGVYSIEKMGKTFNHNRKRNGYGTFKLKEIQIQSMKLDQNGKFNIHSKDFILPAFQQAGKYLVVIAKNQNELNEIIQQDSIDNLMNYAYSVVTLSELRVLVNKEQAKKTNEIELQVLHARTGKPIKQATVEVNSGRNYDSNEKRSMHATNSEGKVKFGVENGHFHYKVFHKSDSISGSDYHYFYDDEEKVATRYAILTDRAIYRPGQTVHVKVIAFSGENPNYTVVSNHEIEMYLEDDNFNELGEISGKTNEFGSFSGSFTIPKSGFLMGQLLINVNDESEKYIAVEEYKRPTFELEADFVQKNYKLGDLVKVNGQVNALAGYGIANARVEISVSSTHLFRYYQSEPIIDTVLFADENGKFELSFLAEVLEKNQGGANFSVNITSTSPAGETQSTMISTFIGKDTPSLTVTMNAEIFSSDSNSISFVFESNDQIDRSSTPLEMIVLKRKKDPNPEARYFLEHEFKSFTKEGFKKAFKSDFYGENKPNLNDSLFTKKIVISDKIQIQRLVENKQGDYIFHFSYTDESGKKVGIERTVSIFDSKLKKVNSLASLKIITKNQSAKVGDVIEFSLVSALKKLNTTVEIYSGTTRVYSKVFTLKGNKTFKYTVQPSDLGGITLVARAMQNQKFENTSQFIQVPFEDKKLKINLETKRDLMTPGQQDKWILTISDPEGKPVSAELLASMYDASLDYFTDNSWYFEPYQANYLVSPWQLNYWNGNSSSFNSYFVNYDWITGFFDDGMILRFRGSRNTGVFSWDYDSGVAYEAVLVTQSNSSRLDTRNSVSVSPMRSLESLDEVYSWNANAVAEKSQSTASVTTRVRSNFNETAFFYPTFYADANNQYSLEFTLPDALTRWNFRGFAHDKNLRIGQTNYSLVAKKELMVQPNVPRFFRAGDAVEFAANVVNTSGKKQTATATLEWFDPRTNAVLPAVFGINAPQIISLDSIESKTIFWKLQIPSDGVELVAYRIRVSSENFADAEEKMIPVLSNRVPVTESIPFTVYKAGETTVELTSLLQNKSTSRKSQSLTFDYNATPLWSVVMSLPYLAEYPYDCAEQTFSKYFATQVAGKILEDHPEIERVLSTWKVTNADAFLSALEQNPEVKSILLAETPWISDAKSETEQRNRIAQLFELNQLRMNEANSLQRLFDMQNSDGGWSWFAGGTSNTFITQHILSGFAQLKNLGIEVNGNYAESLGDGLLFLESKHTEAWKKLSTDQRKKFEGLSSEHVHWLYISSAFEMEKTPAVLYFNQALKQNWTSFPLQIQAMAGTYFQLEDETSWSQKILKSFENRVTKSEKLGNYWAENKTGYTWNQNTIETQAYLIDFYTRMEAKTNSIQAMQRWMLNQKRGQFWESTKTTALACYALLIHVPDLTAPKSVPTITWGNRTIDISDAQRTSTLFSESRFQSEISPADGKISIQQNAPEINMGSLTWNYTEEIGNIAASTNGLTIQKKMYVVRDGKEMEVTDQTELKLGDLLRVRLLVKSDRTLEFVHIKDLRASGTEPTQAISGYHWDQQLSYYAVNKDVSSEFFLDQLPKGTHTLSYELRVSGKGTQTAGFAKVMCLYAPEFNAHSNVVKLVVGE
jgi:uncharacterized protein YfaS (alpha-2-macroglobulin family)